MTDARKLVDDLTTAAGCLSAHGQHDLGMAVARAANLLEPQPPSITTTTGTPWATTVDGPDKPLLTPRTDVVILGHSKADASLGEVYQDLQDFARQLERELAEAKHDAAEWQTIARMERERASATSAHPMTETLLSQMVDAWFAKTPSAEPTTRDDEPRFFERMERVYKIVTSSDRTGE